MINRRKRLFWSIVLMLRRGDGRSTAEFIRKHHLYGSVGNNCMIMKKKLPLYSNLVHLHDNVWVASDVGFVTHDAIHYMLNHKFGGNNFVEKVGCIEVMNNVFIGSGTRILNNIRIGNNVIIGSYSLVNKDIPDNSVYAGIPARYICSFDEYVEKHRKYSDHVRIQLGRDGVMRVDDAFATQLYEDFLNQRKEE